MKTVNVYLSKTQEWFILSVTWLLALPSQLFHFGLCSVQSPLYHSLMEKYLDSSLVYFHVTLSSYMNNVAAF